MSRPIAEERLEGRAEGRLHHERSSASAAWIAAALTPVGVLASILVAYGVAAVIGVTLDPAEGPGPTVAENAIVWSIASLCWLLPPLIGLLLARPLAKEHDRSGVAALAVNLVLLVAGIALAAFSIAGS